MIKQVQMTFLADDSVGSLDLLAEYGLSMLIDAGDRSMLFDTSDGRVLLDNVAAFGIRLAQLDAIVLSRGHYDRTGGLGAGTSLVFDGR